MPSSISIQLVSPASGDILFLLDSLFYLLVSIQLVSPASGDQGYPGGTPDGSTVSIQLVSPASGDKTDKWPRSWKLVFPFN